MPNILKNKLKASSIKHTSRLSFDQEGMQSPVPVLVGCYADRCGPCRLLMPTLNHVADEFAGRVRIVNVDVESRLANQFRVPESAALPELLIRLRSIGIDNVHGVFDAHAVASTGLRTESCRSLPPQELQHSIEDGKVLLDVRSEAEFRERHISGAGHRFLGKLLREVKFIDRSRPVVTQCQSGARSAIAASVLQRAGFDVINMSGGLDRLDRGGLTDNRSGFAINLADCGRNRFADHCQWRSNHALNREQNNNRRHGDGGKTIRR